MVKLDKNIWDEVDALPSGDRTWFNEGVHRVVIESITPDKNTNGTPFLRVEVLDEKDPDIKGKANMYTSEKALPYTLRTLQGILVHNTKTQIEEEKARAYMHKVSDTDDIDFKKFYGAQCWFKKEKNGQTYTGTDGEEHDSYDTGIFNYEPKMSKPQDTILNDEDVKAGEPLDLSDVPFD